MDWGLGGGTHWGLLPSAWAIELGMYILHFCKLSRTQRESFDFVGFEKMYEKNSFGGDGYHLTSSDLKDDCTK